MNLPEIQTHVVQPGQTLNLCYVRKNKTTITKTITAEKSTKLDPHSPLKVEIIHKPLTILIVMHQDGNKQIGQVSRETFEFLFVNKPEKNRKMIYGVPKTWKVK